MVKVNSVLILYFIVAIVKASTNVTITGLQRVFSLTPDTDDPNKVCWVYLNSFFNRKEGYDSRSTYTNFYGVDDQQVITFRDTIITDDVNQADLTKVSIDWTTYTGHYPYNQSTDYCAMIIDVIPRMVKVPGNYSNTND
ncbi:hypothetical protein HG537_0D01340 [Torulaspora globosa]|uniref:Uncharacterized protein n=1 Tax=Torulaspora globosa TaxID=48254 RepID=A0A7H9HS67_9SACH|nr:hypothetical protein HG537_0D01340 [Torulaspora sp. CBS 2947]